MKEQKKKIVHQAIGAEEVRYQGMKKLNRKIAHQDIGAAEVSWLRMKKLVKKIVHQDIGADDPHCELGHPSVLIHCLQNFGSLLAGSLLVRELRKRSSY
ncbi:uncharacterized protein LOC111322909 isoform X4 [Stylophora pistillata]|uniref:uncharacterized protein LOC111322909 isoform X4 n=1 Tax=Stylophora pistillata TaxID=50429 RepID=UPI000C0498C7|nr:uncharacterized protein LOC111322909 isoform X4 [Stylophora pistillata]